MLASAQLCIYVFALHVHNKALKKEQGTQEISSNRKRIIRCVILSKTIIIRVNGSYNIHGKC